MNVIGDDKNVNIVGAFAAGSNVTVKFAGPHNKLEIGPNVVFKSGLIEFKKTDQTVTFSGDNHFSGNIHLLGVGSSVTIGNNTRTNSQIWMSLGEAEDKIEIGDDCIFANVRFRTSDSHRIFDLDSGIRLNPSASIKIQNNVWVAEDVLILKGAVIGRGSAIGARSLVRGVIPPNCVAVGVPARVVRENIRWER